MSWRNPGWKDCSNRRNTAMKHHVFHNHNKTYLVFHAPEEKRFLPLLVLLPLLLVRWIFIRRCDMVFTIQWDMVFTAECFMAVELTVGWWTLITYTTASINHSINQSINQPRFQPIVLLHSMIGYWQRPVVCLSVRPSVCDAVHCGSQGWCTRLKLAPACS